MAAHQAIGALTAAALLAGCATNLGVRPLAATDSQREGISYVLPFTQYVVTETWRVADCTPGSEKVAAKVEATLGQADDGDHAYLIDPASLQRLLTVSDFKATFQDGGNMLQTVNATIEDRTGPFIGNVVKTAAALAPLAFGVPPLPAPGAEPTSICKPEIVTALGEAKRVKGLLETATADVKTANDALLVEAAAAANMGSSIDEGTRKRYGDALKALQNATTIQAGRSSELADALKPITYQRVVRWPETSRCFHSQAFSVDPEAMKKWFVEGTQPSTVQKIYLAVERAGSYGRLPITPPGCPGASALAAAASGRTAGTTAPVAPAGDGYKDPEPSLQGLRYRSPAQGRLVACTAIPCRSEDVETVLTVVEGPVAQLGYVNVLRVRALPFGSNSFSAEFRANGGLSSAGYGQKSAPLEGGAASLASGAEALAPLFDPTKALARETAYLENLKKKRDALAALEPAKSDPGDSARAALEADTAMINAQIANLEAQLNLRALQARIQP